MRRRFRDAGQGGAPSAPAVIADQPAREADQNRREGRQPRTLRHVPDGRGRGTATDVCRHSVVDRSAPRAARTGMTGVIVQQVASGDRRGLCRCTQTSAMQPSGALARRLRARFCSPRARIAVAQGAQRCNDRRKTAGIRRMSVNENVPQQRWAAQRQAGSDGDTRLARGYIIYDGWCNRAGRGADSTVVVPTVATSGSGPRQDAAGTLPISIHDRSWLSSCRAKSAGSVSRSQSRTTEQLNLKI